MERDENIYAHVMDELDDDIKNEALWIKAYAMGEGWEEKIKPKYMQYRVDEIKEEFVRHELEYHTYTKDKICIFVDNNLKYSRQSICIEILWDWLSKNNSSITLEDIKTYINETELNLYGWGINNIPPEIRYCTSFTKMNFSSDEGWCDRGFWMEAPSYNNIKNIPKEIGSLTNLVELDMQCIELTRLPKEFGNLINLTKLNLNNNKFIELPKEIGSLTNLVELDVAHNELKELPKEIGELYKLNNLSLYSNSLLKLPEEIGNLVNLVTLDLWHNQLIELPKNITKLTNLEIININLNPNLTLTTEQKKWIKSLKDNGCTVHMS